MKIALLLLGLLCVPLIALAATPDPVADPEAFVAFAVAVWKAGGWVGGLGLVLMVVISILRVAGERFFPSLAERRKKLLLSGFVAAIGSGLGSFLLTGSVAAGLGVAIAGVVAAWGAFSGVKNAIQG